ncbi:hypothetical protein HanHA300_Chr14g0530101 [Helianthus annuus]|nr:hypothetical protein HanHA300_Chr14g0530101 [Helianthus annuus]KAJ0486284.1 hypothetical protein HanHA89_Chr14g0577971 [Helianthus annuus]KAJ0656836.1 hypothetical protein HanLR1_Chr14g0540391 [Helianthus annuus]
MANNHGSKFVSVNLNKLYGQPSHHNYHSHTGSYGPPGAGPNRARPASAGGGGMVVLSRNRPLQKAMPKLSVPAPLNLPSLRKEYEKTDSSGAGGGGPGAAGSGTGSRPSSSGMGWTKPGNIALQEKEVASDTLVSENVNYSSAKGSGAYMPPSARFGGGDTPSANHSLVEKAMVLRGEDFPSLRAALPSSSAPAQKQKEGSLQPVKKFVSEESSNDVRDAYHFHAPAPMQSSHRMANDVNESPRPNRARLDHALKQEDPLSFLRLNPRSDWADDERDTGHRFAGRDQDLPKSEVYWDRDLDVPRNSILPQKPSSNISERKGATSQVLKAEPYRETNSWRSSIHKERPTGAHAISDGTVTNHFSNSNTHHGVVTENRDPAFVRRDTGQGRHWNHNVEYSKSRNEGYQNSTGSKSVFSLGGKSSFSKSERTYLDDSFQKDFSSSVYDERDPLTGNLVGVMKRKKGVIEQTAFHDPVRESFEAELERVQKMQEMERQRAVEEQERALEHARREDEERRRVILEEEERRRRMEEEAKEAAWRTEQERLDAIQKAEEQKIAREEEKRRMLLEEERRKQAAKQKLLDLEARMAKRGAEVRKSGPDDEVPVGGKDSDASMDSDVDNWEVNQRMVERITTSASSDSSAMDRPFDQPQFSREALSVERGKPVNPWKREAFEVGSNSSFLLNDQENGHRSPRREAPIGGKSFPRKEFYGGGYMSSRSPDTDRLSHLGGRDHRSNSFGDGESYGRNREIESEFYDNVGENYGEAGWGQGHSRSGARSYSERLYMNAESDKLYSYGRSRFSIKQPHVLPPPSSSSSVLKSSVRGENTLSAPSSSLESTARTGNYGGGPQDSLQQSDDLQQDIMVGNLEKNDTLRCDSQSSLSVSSPPSSPIHLSHDELDGSCGSVTPIGGERKEVVNDEPGEVTTMAASKSVSTDEDEEWNIENHGEMQEQEEYDEDDGYSEEDEVLEGPDVNGNLTQEFENLQIEEKNTTNVMENFVLGFNEGVEVRIPGDEFEEDSKAVGNSVDVAEVSAGGLEKQAAVEHEQTQNATSSSVEHEHVSSSGQATLPVQLQFGLFSGPTLIPSPVPAIQIGGMGTSTRSGYMRQTGSTTLKRVVHEAGMNNESKPEKETLITKTQTASSSAESNQQRDIVEEDIDAPLQSGVVRVFKQPGIECLSDEDDFIEVRSKRQMLNERREQREKESKQPRKARVTSTGHKNKLSASLAGEPSNNNRPDVGLVKKEHTVDFSTMASQPVAPIGTATVDSDVQTEIRLHTSKTLQSGSALSGAAADHDSNLTFQTENKVEENVQTSLGDWGNARSDQQVPLTQIQLDEAMKPLSFNTTHIPSIGDHTTLVNEPILSSSSILTTGKSVSSSSSPINSLLAGEKIQFGAVTSPTILAPSSCVVSHGIGAFHSDVTQTTQNITKAENDGNVFTSKDAHPTEDCKAEVEAAVAAVDTDEIVSNGLGRVSVSGTESFGGAVEGIQGGLGGDQQSGSQSKPEESLSVSLPADLSVDTPPISLWPPLPSPQGSSPQMLSHYHGPTPSHFPFYDMNHPMMSAPVFAFGSPDESGGTQPQSQKPTGSAGSRHIGAWQNHSGMDSFYGPPAGFTGPFIGSPGGIPGVQAPPHMVVYNHYSPVGQFGQVGLSFMGAAYIPSGKQPDWKHDPTSTRNEDGVSSMNMVSGPRNPPNMQQPHVQQHLAPGSPLLPMGSPLTMFDVPPFQTAPDMSVQARWSHVPASSLHAVPMPPPLQQQAKVMTGPSQFSSHGGRPVDQSTFPPNRLSEPQASGPSVVSPVVRDSTITHFPDDLGLLDSSGRPSISTTSSPVTVSHSSSATAKIGEGGGVEFKNQHQQDKNKNGSNNNNNHGGGYGYQRGGGLSPKNKSMWSHRRIGRYMGAEKSFPSTTKVKQIYVAKQPTGSSSTVG